VEREGVKVFSAFNVAELGHILPEHVTDDETGDTYALYHYRGRQYFYTAYRHELDDGNWDTCEVEEAHTEADARAKMLIYLLETKLLTL